MDTDAQFYIEQPDGSWQSIPVDSIAITREQDLNEERVFVPVTPGVFFDLPVRFLLPKNPRDFLVSIYETVLRKKCPGSWSTKRLEKKRLKALEDYFSRLDPSAAV